MPASGEARTSSSTWRRISWRRGLPARGLAYGGTSFTAAEVRRILERVELIVFPDINPDGRHYSQTVYAMWRKNRNTASSGGDPSRVGVDDNRNYDFLWDYPAHFDPTAVNNGTLASTNPGSDLFHGAAPFSEAETKNVRWLFDNFPRIRRFIDIHSYGGNILHPWGDDANQSTTASRNFTNPVWNGQRGLDGDAYAEYIVAGDLTAIQTAGNAMKAAIAGVRGESYNVAQSFFMPGWPTTYPTSGASDDWAFSRHYADATKPRVLGYVVEFNKTLGSVLPDLDRDGEDHPRRRRGPRTVLPRRDAVTEVVVDLRSVLVEGPLLGNLETPLPAGPVGSVRAIGPDLAGHRRGRQTGHQPCRWHVRSRPSAAP